MKNKLSQLRAFNRFKNTFPYQNIWLPGQRQKLKRQLKQRGKNELIRTGSNFLIPVGNQFKGTRRIQTRGVLDTATEWVIRRYVKKGSIALDIGANLGFISLLLADQVGEMGKVISLEPNPHLRNYFERLMWLNAINNVERLEQACADEAGTANMSFDADDHSKSKLSAAGEQQVPVTTVDQLTATLKPHVSFLKIDVEGYEAKVLKGAEQTLKQQRPTVLFEMGMHSSEDIDLIKTVLDECNYEIVGIVEDWGVVECELSTNMTDKTHCNVLALAR